MNSEPAFPASWRALDVALCHDWLTGMRGGERVLEILCRAFPDAAVHTLIHDAAAVSAAINAHPVRASWLQRLPGVTRHYRALLPLFPAAVRSLRVGRPDLLISTSHCVAKSVRVPAGTPHLCYCFTPMRYAWTFFREYFGSNPVKALLARPLLAALRRWDRATAAGVTRFVAISRHVRKRIADFYGREADVVYPPVDTARFTPGGAGPESYDLVVSALVPYKRVDLAVRAYSASGRPLRIAGAGGEAARLRAAAGPNVTFLGRRSDAELLDAYRGCRLLVFPGEEDFGIVPLEAQACGKPVVAYGVGGALETVRDGVSGVFFHAQTEEALREAVDRAAGTRWDPDAIRRNAERFDTRHFIAGLAASIERCLGRAPSR